MRMARFHFIPTRFVLAALALAFGLFVWRPRPGGRVLIFAAASLKNALDDTNAAYEKSGGSAIKYPTLRVRPSPNRSKAARRPISSSPPIPIG